MPTIPVWFQARDYFGNKLATMSYADADNGAQQLMDAFNAAGYTIVGLNSAQLNESAEQLYRHFEDYGNAENISPNNYFNVDYYIQQKIDQLATTNQKPPYPFTTWTKDALNAAMDEAGLSYWDHYAQFGTEEGINPSAQFDTNAYLEAKAKQLNDLPDDQKQLLPDGTSGTWTRELVAEALANADLSALEHYYDYGIAEKVDYQPLPEVQPDVYYKTVDLAGLENPVVGTADNENFVGTVGGANATITPDTQIDGGEGQNMLTATMNGNFVGFKNADALQNIDTVTLNNATKLQHTFNAQNAGDVQIWNLNGKNAPISLSNLADTGVTVNINDLAGNSTSAIGFATNVTAGNNDAMTLGVKDLGSAAVGTTIKEKDANIRMDGVENVTLNATGDNYVNLNLVTTVKNLAVTGDGNLKVVSAAPSVNSLDASAANGTLDINLGNSTNFQNAVLGSQNDKLVVSGVNETSAFDGGEGADKVIMENLNGSYRFNMHNVETLQVDGISTNGANTGVVTLSGTDTTNLETLVINAIDPMAGTELVLGEYNTSELTVQTICAPDQGIKGLSPVYQGTTKITDIQDVTLQVGASDKVKENFNGTLDLNAAETVTVNVGGTLGNGDIFSGTIKAPNATALSINMDRFSGGFTTTANTQLANVSQIEVTGYGPVDLSAAAALGSNSQVVSVDASTLENTFKASFGTNQADAILSVMGSSLNGNEISINGDYSSVTVSGGIQRDLVRINVDALSDDAVLDIDLGMGDNQLYVQGDLNSYLGVSGSSASAQQAAVSAWLQSAFNGTVTSGNLHYIDAIESNGQLIINNLSQHVTVGDGITGIVPNSDPLNNKVLDMTKISFVGEDNDLVVRGEVSGTYNGTTGDVVTSLANNDKVAQQTLIFGDTGTDGASAAIAATSLGITTVNATGKDSVVNINATADTAGLGTTGKLNAAGDAIYTVGDASLTTGGAMIDVASIAGGATVNIDINHDKATNIDAIQIGSVVGVTDPNTWGVIHVQGFEVVNKGNALPSGAEAYVGDKIYLDGQYSRLGAIDDIEFMLDSAGVQYDQGSIVKLFEMGTSGVSHAFCYTYGGVENTAVYGVQSLPGSPINGFGATLVVLDGVGANDVAVKNGDVYNTFVDTVGVGGFFAFDGMPEIPTA